MDDRRSNGSKGTGLLSGVPDRSGKVAVVVITTIDREDRRLDTGVLSWENERALEIVNENVGSATRRFRITSAR